MTSSSAPQAGPPFTAVISKEWKKRMIMIAAFIFASGAWFLFDGLFGYPANNERRAAYVELKDSLGEDGDPESAWRDIALEKGWSITPPKKAYTSQEITTQIFIAGGAFVGALIVVGVLILNLPKTLRSDGETIFAPDGTRIPVLLIQSIDKRKWKDQGIALLRYREDGKLKRFVLDDYKFIGADRILAHAEERLKEARETPPTQSPL